MESNDVLFFKDMYPMRAEGSASETKSVYAKNTQVENDLDNHIGNNETPKIPIIPEEDNNLVNDASRRSKRQRVETSFGEGFTVYLVDDVPKALLEALCTSRCKVLYTARP
jgi:hypothetical protein